MKPTVCIVGPGRVGAALGRELARLGYPIEGIVSRSLESATRAREFIGAGTATDDLAKAVGKAERILVATPDRTIVEVGRRLAEVKLTPGSIVFHTSGSVSSETLAPVRIQGARVASAHPLQSFAGPTEAIEALDGIFWALEGDETALAPLEALVADLAGRPHRISTEGKPLYHAAAAVASNYLVALLDVVHRLAGEAGIPASEVMDAFGPLLTGSIANVARLGPAGGLTGPIARGDVETVEGHVASIEARRPELLGIYRALGRHTLEVALEGESFPPEAAEPLRRVLER